MIIQKLPILMFVEKNKVINLEICKAPFVLPQRLNDLQWYVSNQMLILLHYYIHKIQKNVFI